MLHILMVILKAAGILVLTLLLLILLLVILLLVVPIRYEAAASFHEKKTGRLTVSWLLHAVSLKFLYSDGLEIVGKLFGFQVYHKEPGDEEEEEELDSEPFETFEDEDSDFSDEILTDDIPEAKPAETMDLTEDITRTLEEDARKASEKAQAASQKKPREKTGNSLKNKIGRYRKKYRKLKKFMEDEKTKQMFALLKKETVRFCKHLMPQKFTGTLKFGFDDPYYTGMLSAALSPFYGAYGKNVSITPYFDREILEGDLFLKGRISIGLILYILARVMLNKRFRYVLKKVRK